MRQINSLILEIGETEKEVRLSEGAIFHGLQVKQHQIMIWVSEITGAPKDHIVSLSNIIEYGSFDEDWVYIGYCGSDMYAEDETFHVVAHSNTMAINIDSKVFSLENQIKAILHPQSVGNPRKPGRPPKKETENAKANS